jgi:hypothetical protein
MGPHLSFANIRPETNIKESIQTIFIFLIGTVHIMDEGLALREVIKGEVAYRMTFRNQWQF